MDIKTLTDFFMWCTVINGGLLIFWILTWMVASDQVYLIQTKFFPMSRERFDVVFYCFLGAFKMFFIFFSATPFVTLLILGQ